MFVNLASFMGNPVSADCSRSFIFLWGTGLIRFLDLTAYKNHLMLNLINKLSNFPWPILILESVAVIYLFDIESRALFQQRQPVIQSCDLF